MIRIFKIVLISSLVLYIISSILTGMRYPPIEHGDKIVSIGYYESFVFLLIASVVVIMILW
jgi:hypothetical protein